MTPEQEVLFDQLTPLQRQVSTNVLAGMNQRQAYKAAKNGTAQSDTAIDTSASEIMNNPKVKAFMDSMRKQAVSEAIMIRDEAMKILTGMARGNLTDIVKFKTVTIGMDMETGEPLNQTAWTLDENLQETDPDKLMIIESLEVGKNGPKIKAHSKSAAIALLAKMQGWEAASKHEISGPGGKPIQVQDMSELSDEALAAIAAGTNPTAASGD